jgi:sugar phosphate isomerase/epimerase
MCARIAAAGYTDVALFRNALPARSDRFAVLAVRTIAHEAGLAPSMLLGDVRIQDGVETAECAYKHVIDSAATLGAKWVLDTGTGAVELRADYMELLERVLPYAAEAEVQITLKPHGGITLTTDDLIAAHHRIDHPSFGISYDPGNIIYYSVGAERPEANVAAVAPMVTTAIIKDCVVRDGQPDVMVTPGEGWVDFARVLSALVGAGFAGPLYVECVGGDTLEEIDANVRRTYRFLQDTLADLVT